MCSFRSIFWTPVLLLLLASSWLLLNYVLPQNVIYLSTFSKTIVVYSLIGFLSSVEAYYYWGNPASYLGKSFRMFSAGLFFTFIGQLSYTYTYLDVLSSNPYPNYIELFFLLSLICYLVGAYFLGRNIELKLPTQKSQRAFLYCLGVCLFLACLMILITIDSSISSMGVLLLLEVFYPIGQIAIISILLSFTFFSLSLFAKEFFPGMLILFMAFVANYLADLLFTFLSYNRLWRPGDLSDLLYGLSYVLIGYAMALLSRTYYRNNKFDLIIMESLE